MTSLCCTRVSKGGRKPWKEEPLTFADSITPATEVQRLALQAAGELKLVAAAPAVNTELNMGAFSGFWMSYSYS